MVKTIRDKSRGNTATSIRIWTLQWGALSHMLCIIRSTVVCHLHLRNEIILTLGQPLTSGIRTSARFMANNVIMTNRKSLLNEYEQYERSNYWGVRTRCIREDSCRHKVLQGTNTQEVRFNDSSSFLKSALIPLHPIWLLPNGELSWTSGLPLALSLSLSHPQWRRI